MGGCECKFWGRSSSSTSIRRAGGSGLHSQHPALPSPRQWAVLCSDSKAHTPAMWGPLQVCSPLGKIETLLEKFYFKTWRHNRGSRVETAILLPPLSNQKPGLGSSGCWFQAPYSLWPLQGYTHPGPCRLSPPPPLPAACVGGDTEVSGVCCKRAVVGRIW